MAGTTFTLSNFTGLTESYAASDGSSLSTGDLRRKYNFGPYVSALNIAQDPFFRFVSMLRKESVDDPQFKFTEERPSFHKRYAYVVGHGTDGSSYDITDATVTATNIEQGDTWYVRVKTDYKSAGNIGSRYGNSNEAVAIGASGTQPEFFIEGLLVKIPFGSDYQTPKDYIIGKIEQVTKASSEAVDLKLTIIRALFSTSNNELQYLSATAPMVNTYNIYNAANTKENLESKKMYICGNAFAKGSGYPDTWADNPYSTGMGYTQIWKTALGMDNTTRATSLKYQSSEFMRLWGNKLIEHKWDIETDLLFGSQYIGADGIQYTQGAVDYVLNYGQTFSMDHTETPDTFLDHLSQFLDPRMNNAAATLFMADTYTYNWLNKMSGYFNNAVQISPNFRADFAFKGASSKLGVGVNKISTIYGDINITRNVHLDGTGVHILGINMNACRYRPLVGNGINRDTSVYVGVQTLENTGVDKRVDLIMTEAGMEWTKPDQHVIWKR